jgi:hypothetical protein
MARRAIIYETSLERGLDARDATFVDVRFLLFAGRNLDTEIEELLSVNERDPQLLFLSCIH